MATLTNIAEQRTVQWWIGVATTAPVLPYKIRLLSVLGDDATAGTEVSGGSYPAGGVSVTLGNITQDASGDYQAENTALVRFDNMPAGDVVGAELWDSATTPVRWFHGPLNVTRTLVAGDPVEFATGTVKVRAR